MAELIDDCWTSLQFKQILRLRIEACKPVPSLLSSVDASCNAVEALTYGAHWSLHLKDKLWRSTHLQVVEAPDVKLAIGCDSKRALTRSDLLNLHAAETRYVHGSINLSLVRVNAKLSEVI